MIERCLGKEENYDLRMDTALVSGCDRDRMSGCGIEWAWEE